MVCAAPLPTLIVIEPESVSAALAGLVWPVTGSDFVSKALGMLEQTGWNQTEAAERFQVPLSTLNQKIKRLGIEIRRRSAGRGPADPLVQPAESRR